MKLSENEAKVKHQMEIVSSDTQISLPIEISGLIILYCRNLTEVEETKIAFKLPKRTQMISVKPSIKQKPNSTRTKINQSKW